MYVTRTPRGSLMNVELTELTRRFGRTEAVAGVDLQAGPGVFGLLGPNGAGKTSLLRMMATVLPPTFGHAAPARPGSRRLRPAAGDPAPARLPAADPRLLPRVHRGRVRGVLRAAQGHAVRARSRGPWRRPSSRWAWATRRAPSCAPCPAGCCAGSASRRRIVNQPELLLLDEPTAGLDPEQRVAFRTLLREFGQRATVIVSTHLVEDVGRRVHRGHPDGRREDRLPRHPGRADRPGEGHGVGDAPLERGYSAVLAAARS